jgi:regulator of cell morphogenesis and NO signaling
MTAAAADWPDLGALVQHIIHTHHRYVRVALPAIAQALQRLADQHGQTLPDLQPVRRMFAQLGEELLTHMEKEEQILFPYITELAATQRRTGPLPPSPFGTIAHPVRMMEDDHQEALTLMADLRTLTNQYTPDASWTPEDAACYSALSRFEADLVAHIELENTVLFPRALDLEEHLS